MATFLMFGKYSSEAIRDLSAQRTDRATELLAQFGGEIQAMYAALGQIDLVFVLTFPATEDAMKASIALTKLTKIAFTTAPAVTVAQFDALTEGL